MSEHDTCIHEEQIQTHSRKIERLNARSEFKEQKIDELNRKMDNLNEKFDNIIEAFNKLNLKSTTNDKNLELRLIAMETRIKEQEKGFKAYQDETRARNTRQLTIIGLLLTVLTIGLSVVFNLIH